MKSRWNSLVVGSCNVFGLALLALSVTAGGSAVRADDPSTLQSSVFEPLTKIVLSIEQRVAELEATVAAFAGSFSAEHIATRQLCVADDSGAQTCITKAQLDALLKTAVQVGEAPAPAEPGTTQQAASVDTPVTPVTAVAAAMAGTTETPAATDADAGALAESAAATPAIADKSVAAVEETATPMSEGAVAMQSATVPAAEQPTATGDEIGPPLPAAAAVMPPAIEPVDTVIAATTTRETVSDGERREREEEPAHTGAVETNAATPELNAVPAGSPPERAE